MYLGDHENINPVTGNLNIQIPLVHLPGRAGHDLDLKLSYNSNIWAFSTYVEPCCPTTTYYYWQSESLLAPGTLKLQSGAPPIGWDLGVPALLYNRDPVPMGDGYYCFRNYTIVMPDGSTHFPLGITNGCLQQVNGYIFPWPQGNRPIGESTDGGFVLFNADTGAAMQRDGTKTVFSFTPGVGLRTVTGSSVKDRNGNIITYTSCPNQFALCSITDSAGRQITAGPKNAAGLPSTITYMDDNGNPASITLTATSVPLWPSIPNWWNNFGTVQTIFPYTPPFLAQIVPVSAQIALGTLPMLAAITL